MTFYIYTQMKTNFEKIGILEINNKYYELKGNWTNLGMKVKRLQSK